MAKKTTLDWLLKYVREHPGCKSLDVPLRLRHFRELEAQGKIEYRDGGWHIRGEGK